MSREQLLFIIAECLQEHLPKGIKDVSVDGDNDSAEMIIDTKDGDSFVIRSANVEDAI